MRTEWEKSIRFWLMPPLHSLEMGQSIKLTDEQRRHIQPTPHQHQRLRGVAGSGKTLVIAHRAAQLAAQGRRVLIVGFNITLSNYIHDFVSNSPYNFNWGLIEIIHFHGFCYRFLAENDQHRPYIEDFAENIAAVVALANKLLEENRNCKHREYDAILIDEGQDFEREWYLLLTKLLTANDEVLFVADERQNIYQRDMAWIDNMSGTKFRGRWRELKSSYRLSFALGELANQFASAFLLDEGVPVEKDAELMLPGFDYYLHWFNLSLDQQHAWVTIIEKLYDYWTKDHSVHPADIVILVPTHKRGWELVNYFKYERQIEVNHVFKEEGDGVNANKHKRSFWMGDSRLKICTIHSFKGWEVKNVILLIPSIEDRYDENASLDRMLYTAITRSRQHLIILNQQERYWQYGELWPNEWKNSDD
jgi:superfamily I DNA/RNA helicase